MSTTARYSESLRPRPGGISPEARRARALQERQARGLLERLNTVNGRTADAALFVSTKVQALTEALDQQTSRVLLKGWGIDEIPGVETGPAVSQEMPPEHPLSDIRGPVPEAPPPENEDELTPEAASEMIRMLDEWQDKLRSTDAGSLSRELKQVVALRQRILDALCSREPEHVLCCGWVPREGSR